MNKQQTIELLKQQLPGFYSVEQVISIINDVDTGSSGDGYCASKHAVDAISKAMRIDLLKHNIKVIALHPGAVETEFSLVRFKGEKEKVLKNIWKRLLMKLRII